MRKYPRRLVPSIVAMSLIFSMLPLFPVAAEEGSKPVVLHEYGFEKADVQGWGPRGSGVVVETSTEAAKSGTSSLKTSGRTAGWNGPSLNVKSILEPNVEYEITGYVKLAAPNAEASEVKLSIEEKPAGADTAWKTVGKASIGDKNWTKLQGTYKYTGEMTDLVLYAESSNATETFYLDDVSIKQISAPPVDQVGIKSDFEDGTVQGWTSRMGKEVVSASNVEARNGTYSLLTTGREHTYGGPKLDVTGKMQKGSTYSISVWVKLAKGEKPTDLRLSMQRDFQSEETRYNTVIGDTKVTADNWVQLSTNYLFGYTVDTASLYLESTEGTPSFYIDDFELTYVPPVGIEKDIPSLYAIYKDDFNLGTAIEAIQTEGEHGELLKKHFNSIVAGNAMKPGSISPVKGQYRWEDADKIVKFAVDNNISIRFHTLVWHSQAADWMFKDDNGVALEATPENKALVLKRLEEYIRVVVDRYKDVVTDWDVVNEVIDPSEADGMRRSEWFRLTGTDFIETAFRVTREVAGEKAKLFINDYNTHDPKKRDFLYKLVTDMLAKGVPIDGVGHQTHINVSYPSIDLIEQSIVKFADIGLDNQITEMDVSVYTNDTDKYDSISEDLNIKQAYRYKELFDMFVKHKKDISNVTIWGTDDGNTWLSTFPITRLNTPLLFDSKLQSKYAYWALVDMTKVPPLPKEEDVPAPKQSETVQGMPKIDGIEDAIWSKAQELTTDTWVQGKNGATAKVSTLWNGEYLYVWAKVKDPLLSKASVNAYEQDSIEIFVDQNNAKTASYDSDDGQYRINYEGVQTYNGNAKASNITSATKILDDGYVVEAAIKLDQISPTLGTIIGFDVQVNDDSTGTGTRSSVVTWNDPTGKSYMDSSRFGELKLVAAKTQEPGQQPDKGPGKSPGNPGSGSHHIVKPGDTLYSIAKKYGVTWQKLMQWNDIANPHRIYPGQKLIVR